MADIYSTNDAGKILEINPNTIKTWKNRSYKERLIETTHWFNQDGSTFWTESGMSELRAIQSQLAESDSDSPMNQSATQPESDSDSIKAILSPLESRYMPLIEMLAEVIAPRLQRQLDQKVMGRVKGFATNAQEMTATECVELLQQLGLKPADPAALLTGSNIQALPQSNQ